MRSTSSEECKSINTATRGLSVTRAPACKVSDQSAPVQKTLENPNPEHPHAPDTSTTDLENLAAKRGGLGRKHRSPVKTQGPGKQGAEEILSSLGNEIPLGPPPPSGAGGPAPGPAPPRPAAAARFWSPKPTTRAASGGFVSFTFPREKDARSETSRAG